MMTTVSRKADCYSKHDRIMMDWWQGLRSRCLGPMLTLLHRAGITADGITLFSFVLGLGFCVVYFVSPVAAFVCLLLHVVIDGLDGPLARHTDQASARGSLTDTMCDQCIVAASTVTMMAAGIIDPIPGGLYVFLYTLVVAFAMVRNALVVPYAIVLRPRFLVYVWLAVEVYLWPGSTNVLLWILLIPLAWQAYRGFRAIRSNM